MRNSHIRNTSLGLNNLDWVTVVIYMVLVMMGLMNIYASSYSDAQTGVLDFNQRSGMQFLWIGVCFTVALVILLLDNKYYHIAAYPLYWVSLIILVGVTIFGREINGARSWIMVGPVAFQPTELVKFTTALALSRFMSSYWFSIHRFGDLLKIGVIIGLPFMIIILQNDTGSALVYTAFLLALYREGLNSWLFGAIAMAIMVFVLSFLVTEFTLLVTIILVCTVAEGLCNGRWRDKIIYLSCVALATMIIYFGSLVIFDATISPYISLLISATISLSLVLAYAYRNRLRKAYNYVVLGVCAVVFGEVVDYVFENILQSHQRDRILDVLGLISDPKGAGYNVNQSKIAIGSGGVFGKGFLNGTQTRYNFVPEQGTDFIFSSVGEEWGFVGCTLVIVLLGVLILRIMKMGERQQEAFGRIYCYCVASIFLFHVLINIGMVIGIMPVIGIPLPFFSYGGSSLLSFTVLLFVAIKMDSSKRDAPTY